MRLRARTYFIGAVLLLAGLALSCSTSKNTSGTRFYHGMTARFNTMYNGQKAFDEGVEAQQKGHVDNYTELLPMFIVADKKTAAMGKGSFETAIEKSQKAIKRHSIKRKPKKPSGRMTAKQKAFFARKEFNPYLHHAWMMMADAQLQKGEFIEAAASYNYILRLYSDQPEVASVARAKLARCYVLLEWPYDAEDVFSKIRRDSISPRGQRELDATRAAYLIETGQAKDAIAPLAASIKHTKGKQAKARLYYLLGQLNQQAGQNQAAYKALKKCVRLNPPYELAFNARILQTEVMADGQGKAMIRKLRRMAKNPNNANYLDRIYYAIGNIYFASKDTMHTIYAWKKGIEESTQNGFAKAVVLQSLGELYWERENYIDAADCYGELAGLMDKEHEQYKEVQQRSKILAEIQPHLSAVKLQDSLQVLAKLPEKEYLAAIDRVIDELKKKEKEEEKRAEAQGTTGSNRTNAATTPTTAQNATNQVGAVRRGSQTATFYFYTPQTVMQGKQEFQRRWGNRPNEDNWRRSTKQSAGNAGDNGEFDYGAADSLGVFPDGMGENGVLSEEEQHLKDSLENDPHQREFYLKQIPFTAEQLEASNAMILDGLYHGGVLEMEKIGNYPLAQKTLNRLMTDFPDFGQMDDVYYHMFLLAMRNGNGEEMERYTALLQEAFPESKLTKTITNPRFIELAQNGRHLEDTLYAQTYDAYKAGEYWKVEQNVKESTEYFEDGTHRAKFLFIHAMTQLYSGQRDSFFAELKVVAEKYSKDEVAELAKAYVKGIQDGRLLASDKWDASDIWSAHAIEVSRDSTAAADSLVADPKVPYVFVLAYPTGEVDEDQLLFEMARYNFTSFMARNFDIETVKSGVISQLRVTGFASYDEVHAYAQQLYGDNRLRQRLEGIRAILISEANLKLLGTRYSYDEYAEFYEAELSPLEVPEDLILDEPENDFPTDIDDIPENGEKDDEEATDGEEEEDTEDDEDWLF
ncbi:MAG: hypothetical protein K6A32_03255 [Bacteroidales bacterium]|nr:hypothetical protein [Bacteroidales bacterium]